MALWKKILLRSIGVGAGLGIVLLLAMTLYVWWSGRPKEWSSVAITAKPTEVTITTADEMMHFRFRYALSNHTKDNYIVPMPEDAALMRKLPEDASLEKMSGADWDKSVTIPPGQTVNLRFDVPIVLGAFSTSSAELGMPSDNSSGQAPSKYIEFVNTRLKEMNGFVLMDYGNRYRIELPSNWEGPKSARP